MFSIIAPALTGKSTYVRTRNDTVVADIDATPVTSYLRSLRDEGDWTAADRLLARLAAAHARKLQARILLLQNVELSISAGLVPYGVVVIPLSEFNARIAALDPSNPAHARRAARARRNRAAALETSRDYDLPLFATLDRAVTTLLAKGIES